MRISDWSSDVCSSDLLAIRVRTKLDTDANLVIRTFGLSRTKLVASPSLLDARGRPSTPGELSHLPALSMREPEGTQTWELIDAGGTQVNVRSEEHTSTPVTNAHLVCRLMLEKKNPPRKNH